MFRRARALFLASVFMAGSPSAALEFAWSDEFDHLSLNEHASKWDDHWIRWNIRHLTGNDDKGYKINDRFRLEDGSEASDHLRKSYPDWPDDKGFLHDVSDGTIKLRAFSSPAPELGEGFPYWASMLTTERKFAQADGVWEVRFRINAIGKGQHIAIWMLSDRHVWPPEIDLLEVIGTEPLKIWTNARTEPPSPEITSSLFVPDAGSWNTIRFERRDGLLTWNLNGVVVRQHEDKIPPDERFYFLISWEVASRWPGLPDETTPWPAEIELDYVRIYR